MTATAQAETEVNPWEAAPYLTEAFSETLGGMSESEIAELVELIIRGDNLVWAGALQPKVASYLEESVYLVSMGEMG